MAEVKKVHGVSLVGYVNGVAVDPNGNEIEGAPKQPRITPANEQPGAVAPVSMEDKLAAAITAALAGKSKAKAPHEAEDEGDEDEGDITLSELPAHLESISNVDELRKMKRADKRKGGKEAIQARIDALKSAE